MIDTYDILCLIIEGRDEFLNRKMFTSVSFREFNIFIVGSWFGEGPIFVSR